MRLSHPNTEGDLLAATDFDDEPEEDEGGA
jgi:hypothetical protein